jgi:tetraacyldisaccharide 4'-kinase
LVSPLYSCAAAWRRRWYDRHPEACRHLGAPVISVGNIVVGGSGKTPVVAMLARLLRAAGARPSVLSRGYARRHGAEGVIVVSDGERVLEPVGRSGDEPQMLARALPGVPVLVSPDRYLAGLLAERRFQCNVHILDDGFQHLQLKRDVDLVIVAPDDLDDDVLPAGRLRESIDAARRADALLVYGTEAEVSLVSAQAGVATGFRVIASFERPRSIEPFDAPASLSPGTRVLAVAGIARPERFFEAIATQDLEVVKPLVFPDHHWFDADDLEFVLTTARAVGAQVVMTTQKDAVRWAELPLAGIPRAFVFLPMTVHIEPAERFDQWLRARLEAAARTASPAADGGAAT